MSFLDAESILNLLLFHTSQTGGDSQTTSQSINHSRDHLQTEPMLIAKQSTFVSLITTAHSPYKSLQCATRVLVARIVTIGWKSRPYVTNISADGILVNRSCLICLVQATLPQHTLTCNRACILPPPLKLPASSEMMLRSSTSPAVTS